MILQKNLKMLTIGENIATFCITSGIILRYSQDIFSLVTSLIHLADMHVPVWNHNCFGEHVSMGETVLL